MHVASLSTQGEALIIIIIIIIIIITTTVHMYRAIFLIYFAPAAVILPASLVLMVQFSLPYKRAGRDRVL
jgi:hypothetical protein